MTIHPYKPGRVCPHCGNPNSNELTERSESKGLLRRLGAILGLCEPYRPPCLEIKCDRYYGCGGRSWMRTAADQALLDDVLAGPPLKVPRVVERADAEAARAKAASIADGIEREIALARAARLAASKAKGNPEPPATPIGTGACPGGPESVAAAEAKAAETAKAVSAACAGVATSTDPDFVKKVVAASDANRAAQDELARARKFKEDSVKRTGAYFG